jgi:hypothetical protein
LFYKGYLVKYNVLLFAMLFFYQVISPSQHQHSIAAAASSSSTSSYQSRPNRLKDRLCQLLFSFRQHDSGTTDQEPLTPTSQMIFDSVKRLEDENRKHKEDKFDLQEKLCEIGQECAHFQKLYQDAIDDREAEIKRRTNSLRTETTALWHRYIIEADQLKKANETLHRANEALQRNNEAIQRANQALQRNSLVLLNENAILNLQRFRLPQSCPTPQAPPSITGNPVQHSSNNLDVDPTTDGNDDDYSQNNTSSSTWNEV